MFFASNFYTLHGKSFVHNWKRLICFPFRLVQTQNPTSRWKIHLTFSRSVLLIFSIFHATKHLRKFRNISITEPIKSLPDATYHKDVIWDPTYKKKTDRLAQFISDIKSKFNNRRNQHWKVGDTHRWFEFPQLARYCRKMFHNDNLRGIFSNELNLLESHTWTEPDCAPAQKTRGIKPPRFELFKWLSYCLITKKKRLKRELIWRVRSNLFA